MKYTADEVLDWAKWLTDKGYPQAGCIMIEFAAILRSQEQEAKRESIHGDPSFPCPKCLEPVLSFAPCGCHPPHGFEVGT